MFGTLSLVAIGGALGSAARCLVGLAAMRAFGTGFPVGTLLVNVGGSFLMGVLAIALVQADSQRSAPFLMTGVLGGFTTFSAFSLDTINLWERGEALAAAGYLAGSVMLSLCALVVGMATARGIWA